MPHLACGDGLGGHRGKLGLQDLLTLLTVGMGTPSRGETAPQRFFVPDVGRDVATRRDDVVGQQAQPRVTHRRLDDAGLAGDFRLPAQRTQLAPQFGGQVGQASEIGGHRLQLAQGFFLALAVLEDTGGFLHKGAPVLRTGVQYRVQLALTDDDVQLTADSGVAHELLDVQQPTRAPVDRVFALATAEHQATDRHLAVVDGQGAVGVVDGEQNLGTAQWWARRCAGEDDVRHRPATQCLRTLLAEYPCHRVDDVALTGAVRPHNAGDAGFEVQGRRTRERLETPQGEALEMHLSPELSEWTRAAGTDGRSDTNDTARQAPDSTNGALAARRDVPHKEKRPLTPATDSGGSGQRGLCFKRAKFVRDINAFKCIVKSTGTRELIFQFCYTCTKSAYLIRQTNIVARADVAKKGLRHDGGPPR